MSNPQTVASFPNQNIPDGKKDKEWHKQAVEVITNRSLNQTYNVNYVAMNEAVNFFQSLNVGEEFKFLQQSEDGETLPAQWMHLNRIQPKLKIVLGEFMEKGYDISVKAINKEAVSRRLKEKDRLLVEMRLDPYAKGLEQSLGLPMTSAEQLPEDEEDLDDYIKLTYKETSEFVMESALKWLSKRFNWDYTRFAMFRDILIMGKCFGKVEIVNGLPQVRRIDPRLMIYDTNATDDFLSDATYFGEVRYMSLAEAAEQYGLTKEEIEEVSSDKNSPKVSGLSTGIGKDALLSRDNQIIYYKQDGGEMRVLVVTAYWQDTKSYNHKESKDNYGNTHIKKVKDTEEAKDGQEIIKKRVKIWRKGTIIGGKILKDWGEMEDQARDVDNISETYPPYVACLPYYLNGTTLSLTQLLMPLQNFKNITAYNLQVAMARAGASGVTIDVSQIPEGMHVDQVIKYLKVVGVQLIDSKKDGVGSSFNQFQKYDMTISDSIVRYIDIMDRIDREMDAVTGINEARQGMVQNSSQAVGVTQSALFQSNLATSSLFRLFQSFASKALNQQARLVKIAWVGKEKFAPIIGDTGVDFLEMDIELDLNDYGVFVEEVPPLIDDINVFREFIMAALQSGKLDFGDAMDLMLEKDVKIAVRRFKKVTAKKEKEQMIQEQQMQEQQLAAQQQMAEQQAQVQQQGLSNKLELEQIRGANQAKNTLTKGRIDLGKEKISLLK
jgi:hypothetical protein